MLYNEGWFTLSNNVLHKTWQSTCSCKLLPCNIVIMLTWNFWIQFSPSLPCELREPAGGPWSQPVPAPNNEQTAANTTPLSRHLLPARDPSQDDVSSLQSRTVRVQCSQSSPADLPSFAENQTSASNLPSLINILVWLPLLALIFSSPTVLKRFKTPHSLFLDFGADKPLQLRVVVLVRRRRSSRVQVWVEVLALTDYLQSCVKAVPESNRRFWLQNQWQSCL